MPTEEKKNPEGSLSSSVMCHAVRGKEENSRGKQAMRDTEQRAHSMYWPVSEPRKIPYQGQGYSI